MRQYRVITSVGYITVWARSSGEAMTKAAQQGYIVHGIA